MKICYLADGESVHTIRWCNHFVSKGNEVHLISFKNVVIPGVHVHYVNAGKISAAGGNWQIIFKFNKVRSIVKQIKPDILHALYASSYGLTGALSGFHPYIITALGTDVLISPFRSFTYNMLIRFALWRADWVTSMADHMTEKLIGLGVPERKISVVVFGIDDKVFNRSARDIPKDKFILTSTRNFEPVYNMPLLFNALKKVKEKIPNLHVNLIGDGSLRNNFEMIVKRLGIDDIITFMGKVSQERIAEVLNRTHLFVTVSLSDGNNISLNEAMACGTFAIASDIPANRQWIAEGINGFKVPVDNSNALAEKIYLVYQNFYNYESGCIAYNDKIISEKALWEKNMEQVQQKYESLITEKIKFSD